MHSKLLNVCVHVHLRDFRVNTRYFIIWLRFVLFAFSCRLILYHLQSSRVYFAHLKTTTKWSAIQYWRSTPVYMQDLGFRSFLQRTSPAMLSPHRTSPAMLSFQNTSPAMLSPPQQVIIKDTDSLQISMILIQATELSQ